MRLWLALVALAGCGGDSTPEPSNVPPAAQLSATPTLVAIGDPVAFSAGGSVDSDGEIVAYRFVFADGSPALDSGSSQASHRFAAAGLYQVTLTVTDDDGATATTTTAVNVTDLPPP
jgi:PKD repeat protein